MPKNIEDIIPSGRKSIRSIPVPVRRVEKSRMPEAEIAEQRAEMRAERAEREEPRRAAHRPRSPRKNILTAGAIGLALVIFAFLAIQKGAILAYVPKAEEISFNNDSYVARQSASGEDLSYSIIKLSGDKSVTAVATAEESASDKASGKVVIYNEQSSPQQLVKTTRLETADGKIYRITEDVSVPAKGNVEVTAVADQAGPSYNIPLSDFTIPGLKGSAKYELVYARSKTPMTGGFTGMRKKVNQSDLDKAKSSLEGILKNELISQARAQMPSDFVLFPGLAEITYEILPVESAGEASAKITVRGNLSAVIFKREDLANYLASSKLGDTKVDAPVEVADFSTLNVVLDESQTAGVASAESLKIKATGKVIAKYLTDEVALASDLVGVSKGSVNQILKSYPSIESAEATIRPFWKSTFPSDVSKIKIEEKN